MRSSFSRRGARLTGVQSCPEATGFRKGPAGSAQPGALPLFLLPCAASSRPKPSSPCVGEASGLCIRPGSVGLALAGIGSGWGGGRGGEEGPDNKGDIQGLCWSRRGEWKATVCRSVQPWQGSRGLIRKCCSPSASGAGTEPCAHRTELPLWGGAGVPPAPGL